MNEDKYERTPEEVKLNDVLKSASDSISKINDEISKLEKDKGNTPRPSPFGNTAPTTQKEALKNNLLQEKKNLENFTRETIDKDIKESGKEPTAIMNIKIEEWNEDTSKYPKDAHEIRQENKTRDISESQKFAIKIKVSDEARKTFDNLVKEETANGIKPNNLGNKFENSLRFTQFRENTSLSNKSVDKDAQALKNESSGTSKSISRDFTENKKDIDKDL